MMKKSDVAKTVTQALNRRSVCALNFLIIKNFLLLLYNDLKDLAAKRFLSLICKLNTSTDFTVWLFCDSRQYSFQKNFKEPKNKENFDMQLNVSFLVKRKVAAKK